MTGLKSIVVVNENEVERNELDSKLLQVLNITSKINRRVSAIISNNNDNVEKLNKSVAISNKNFKLLEKRTSDLYTILEVQKNQLNSLFAITIFQGIVILLLIIGMTNLYFKKIRVEIPIGELRVTDTASEEMGD